MGGPGLIYKECLFLEGYGIPNWNATMGDKIMMNYMCE